MQSRYIVYLAAVGNPDFDQPMNLGIPARMVAIESLEEASQVCLRFIEKYDLGGGNWIGGDVYDGKSGQKLAYVSYNGMVKLNGELIKNDRS